MPPGCRPPAPSPSHNYPSISRRAPLLEVHQQIKLNISSHYSSHSPKAAQNICCPSAALQVLELGLAESSPGVLGAALLGGGGGGGAGAGQKLLLLLAGGLRVYQL